MAEPEEESFADPLPGLLRSFLAEGRDLTGLKGKLAEDLTLDPDKTLQRWSELPDLEPTAGPHVPLLLEARDLYRHGHFYSCVAMCGIASERIVKDVLRAGLAIWRGDKAVEVPEQAIPELDRFELSAIARFLTKVDLLVPAARKAVLDLAELRNRYAHSSATKPREDALRAIGLLHDVVNLTVSLFAGQERLGSGPQADSLPGAVGCFGFEPTNPIPGDYIQNPSFGVKLRWPRNNRQMD